jgi:hypothetical protein
MFLRCGDSFWVSLITNSKIEMPILTKYSEMLLGQALFQTRLTVEGSLENASWRWSLGEGRQEKVSHKRLAGECLLAKADWRRALDEGQLEKASRRRSRIRFRTKA